MDYRESVLVPIEIINKCYLYENNKFTKLNIDEKSREIKSIKVKRYTRPAIHLFRYAHKVNTNNQQDIKRDNKQITSLFPINYQPKVNSILGILSKYPEVITWDTKLRLTINGDFLVGSDLVELLRYVLGLLTITSYRDVPKHSKLFHDTLLLLNVPKEWMKIKIKPSIYASALRRTPKKPQKLPRYDSDTDNDIDTDIDLISEDLMSSAKFTPKQEKTPLIRSPTFVYGESVKQEDDFEVDVKPSYDKGDVTGIDNVPPRSSPSKSQPITKVFVQRDPESPFSFSDSQFQDYRERGESDEEMMRVREKILKGKGLNPSSIIDHSKRSMRSHAQKKIQSGDGFTWYLL